MFLTKLVQFIQQFVECSIGFEFQRLGVQLVGSGGIFDGIVDVLLHVTLQYKVGQETKRDVPLGGLVVNLDRVDNLVGRDSQIGSPKVCTGHKDTRVRVAVQNTYRTL